MRFFFYSLLLGGLLYPGHVVRAGSSCQHYEKAKKVGNFVSDKIDESSGIAASHLHKGVWWTHNDSGGKARVFAFDLKGNTLGRFDVTGASNADWEDIASGPCPDGSPCLYIADVGDNAKSRKDIVIYRVREPKTLPGSDTKAATVAADVFRLTYPDGAHNCETLLVHPITRDLILLTKETNRTSAVFVLPGGTQPGTAVLKKVTTLKLDSGTLTGGDLSSNGHQIIVRTYSIGILYAPGPDGIPRDSNKIGKLPLPFTIQGEAIAYDVDGQSLVLTSEFKSAPIYQLLCKTPKPEPPKPEPPKPEPPKPEPPNQEPRASTEKKMPKEPIMDAGVGQEKGQSSTDQPSGIRDKSFRAENKTDVSNGQKGCGCESMSGTNATFWMFLFLCGFFIRLSAKREQFHGDSDSRSGQGFSNDSSHATSWSRSKRN